MESISLMPAGRSALCKPAYRSTVLALAETLAAVSDPLAATRAANVVRELGLHDKGQEALLEVGPRIHREPWCSFPELLLRALQPWRGRGGWPCS